MFKYVHLISKQGLSLSAFLRLGFSETFKRFFGALSLRSYLFPDKFEMFFKKLPASYFCFFKVYIVVTQVSKAESILLGESGSVEEFVHTNLKRLLATAPP